MLDTGQVIFIGVFCLIGAIAGYKLLIGDWSGPDEWR
jgi:hypothetical protein